MTQINPSTFQPSLTNLQVELLKVFAMQLPEEHLKDLRLVIARYLMEKARDRADTIWDKKGYDETTIKKLINGEI
jgi:hypothetical protein